MLIHGRYAYHRTAFVANYSFYKSLFICFMQILYVQGEERDREDKREEMKKIVVIIVLLFIYFYYQVPILHRTFRDDLF